MNLILAVVGCWYHGKTVCVLDSEKMESRSILLAWARYPWFNPLYLPFCPLQFSLIPPTVLPDFLEEEEEEGAVQCSAAR